MTVCLMQQICNSGVYWRLPTSRRRSLGWKLWLISFLSTVLLTKSPPWQTSMQVFLGPLSVGAGKAESASYSNYRRPLQWFNCFYSQRQPPYFHYGTVSFQGCKGSHLWCPCIFHCLLFWGDTNWCLECLNQVYMNETRQTLPMLRREWTLTRNIWLFKCWLI